MIGLNIGCHEYKIKGFINLDMDKSQKPDIVADAEYLPFKDNSFEIVYASGIIEHFPHTKTKKVLKEWRRVLSKGGELYLSQPDFKEIIDMVYLQRNKDFRYGGNCRLKYLRHILWGDQGGKYQYHYVCYDYPMMKELLQKVGFSKIHKVDIFGLIDDRSNQWVALNIIAIK